MRSLFMLTLIGITIAPLGMSSHALAHPAHLKPKAMQRMHVPTSPKIIVAVIDTGIDPTHVRLTKDIWRDPQNKKTRVYGWNFVTNQPNPRDENGHGTHIAGIIRSITNRKVGDTFLASKISLMPLKYYSEGSIGTINLEHSVNAIHYANAAF